MKNGIKIFGVGLVMLLCNEVAGQCVAGPYSFQPGERLTYEVAYNWGMVWVDAGEVVFSVGTLKRDGQTFFYFDSKGKSYKFYDWIYKVRDRFQSHVQVDGYYPVWFMRNTKEGGYEVNNSYSFDWRKKVVVSSTENSNKLLVIDTLPVEPCTFDVLSAIYYARSIDFDVLTEGEKVPIRFIIDGEFYELFIRYMGKEVKKNRSGKKYLCNKFSAMLVEGTMFAGGEEMVVWVTADENKIPLMVEAKILIGSIKAYLKGFENLVSELEPLD